MHYLLGEAVGIRCAPVWYKLVNRGQSKWLAKWYDFRAEEAPG